MLLPHLVGAKVRRLPAKKPVVPPRKNSANSPRIWAPAIKDTADQAGRLQQYLDAMSEYRSAARLGEWGEAAQEEAKNS